MGHLFRLVPLCLTNSGSTAPDVGIEEAEGIEVGGGLIEGDPFEEGTPFAIYRGVTRCA